ncbi:MAG: TRAP transporter large permease subunit [Oscillospiraceae bacterium]|nr:TRAP transporter large permease subunit [Oscillospiraceae bacterium]
MINLLAGLVGNFATSAGMSTEQFCAFLIGSLFILMIIGLVLGQELAFVLGGAGVIIGVIAWGNSALTISMTKMYDQMQSYSMVAIPMFVLMANFLTHSKVADGLFLSIRYLLGPLKGGLGLAVILVSTIFAATTGIVGASVVTMGMLSIPILMKCGYNKPLAAGMVCAGGTLGILIPPSIMLVSMASYAEVSVGKLFFAALVPGLMLSAGYCIYILVTCHIHPNYGPAMSKEELAEMPLQKRITGSLVNLIPPLILILGVLGSIFTGIATPTEAAGVGALFALILAILYKQFSWRMFMDSLIDTAKTTSMVFIILFGAAAFTGIFLSLDGDVIITDFVMGLGIGKWGALAIMMLIVFLMGMFIDWTGIIMIVLPIFLPIMDNFGFDRLWLVGMLAVLLQTCFMTPPFGFALFYIKGIVPEDFDIKDIYKGVIPFIAIVLIVTVLTVVFPNLIVGLPNMVAN